LNEPRHAEPSSSYRSRRRMVVLREADLDGLLFAFTMANLAAVSWPMRAAVKHRR